MESYVAGVAKSYHLVPSLFMSNAKHSKMDYCPMLPPPSSSPTRLRLDKSRPPIREKKKMRKELNCTPGASSLTFPEKQQLGDDETTTITEEELMLLGKLGDKCKEVSGGIAELLECLESEAIMGDDQGKEPTDYNRRAQIFDKSSRVFQALKQNATTSVD